MSLRFKTVIGVALIEALLLAYLIFTVVSYMQDSAGEALQKRAKTTATLFATTSKDPILSFDLASLESFSNELLKNPDLEYVRVLDTAGQIFSEAGNPEIIKQPFQEDFSLSEVNDGIYDVSAKVSEGGIVYGRIELGINTDSINMVIKQSQELSIAIAVVEMALVALFSFLLGTYLTRQLNVLRRSAKKISEGDYSCYIPINSRDEVAEVAKAFNRMTVALRDSESSRDEADEKLKELNLTLEDRVVRRTEKINQKVQELKLANSQLAETQSKLIQSEKLASVGQLAAGVAHEINNPIGFIRSNLNTLSEYVSVYNQLLDLYQSLNIEDRNKLESVKTKILKLEEQEDMDFVREDIADLLTDSIEGTVRVRDIVQGLKEFSHVNGTGKEPCDINHCISSTLKIVNNELKYKCVIETDLQSVPMITGNIGELGQVFMNLLINAGQAIDSGGHISISTSEVDDFVEVCVADNGQGIKKENIDRLFDPFFTTKSVGEGTGLGLAISFGIVKDHGGEILVESEPGVGTIFKLQLPIDSSDGLVNAA